VMAQPPNPPLQTLKAKAEGGDVEACFALARVMENFNPAEALRWMETAEQGGKPEAAFMLGVYHTEGTLKKRELDKGFGYLKKAKAGGVKEAARYRALLKARGIGPAAGWADGIGDLLYLAGDGDKASLEQVVLLLLMTGGAGARNIGKEINETGPKPALFGAKEFLQTPPLKPLSNPKVFSNKPYIAHFPNVLEPEVAQEQYRTSTEIRFTPFYSDFVVEAVCHRIAQASGEDISQQEILGVLCYQPGQEYKPHSDFLKPDVLGNNPEVDRAGQRIKTFLIYLNEGFEGGETEFPKLGLALKGKKGDGILFSNVTDSGQESTLSFHAGRPVLGGEKLITTMWIRDKKYTYPMSGD